MNLWTIWYSPGQNNGVGIHFLLQRILPTQGLNPGLPHCRWILYQLSHKEDIKKRWKEYTEELYKKDFQKPDNHDGVITHLELEILECEVKWALGSITTNKDSGGDGIPVELFQILKDDAVRCCIQYVSKFGELSSGHRTGKGQFSSQTQRRTMSKNVQTAIQLWSFHRRQVRWSGIPIS